MPFKAKVFLVMIASPSDVLSERQIARELLHEWNDLYALSKQTILLPVGWESNSAPMMGERAQEIINRQVLEKSDYLIGIFWTRLGTPTGEFASGTVEEIEKHLESGKLASIYFSSRPEIPESIDQQQFQKLQEFKRKCQTMGLIQSYHDLDDFRNKLRKHLVITVDNENYFRSQIEAGEIDVTQESGLAFLQGQGVHVNLEDQLSPEGKELLLEASQDRAGLVHRINLGGGTLVQTNGKTFGEMGNPRSEARWSAALKQLSDEGLLQALGYKGEAFQMTDLGYQVSDRLAAK